MASLGRRAVASPALAALVAQRSAVGSLSSAALSREPPRLLLGAPLAAQVVSTRGLSGEAASKMAKTLAAELKHEEDKYKQAKEIHAFLKSSPFKLVETQGDVNMALEREVGDRVVRIEWQLSSPFDPGMTGEDGEDSETDSSTELSITVESKKGGAGMIFYCSTSRGEDHRYVVGNVKSFASAEEKDSVSSYHGPEFEDLDDKLQEALDEYLAELGMGNDICDFVDAMAGDKEQREYIRWLKLSKELVE